MDQQKNAPTEQAQNLLKDCKVETPDRKFEDILAITSDYYGEVLEKLANDEPFGEK